MRRLLALLIVLLCFGCVDLRQGAGRPFVSRTRVVVGYLPAFKGLDRIVDRVDLTRYTHVDLAFANPAPDGSMVVGETMACMTTDDESPVSLTSLRRAVSRVHHAGAKALLSIGGGAIPSCSGDWAALLRPASRAAVVDRLVELVDAENLDGIDVDLEGELLTRIDGAGNFVPFVEALGRAMRARGRLLTCATASYEDGMVPVASIPWFDLVNIMSYDAVGPTWGRAGDEHATLAMAERDLALWRSRGVPKNRLVLGVPFYGRGFGAYPPRQPFRDVVAEHGLTAVAGDVVGTRCADCSYVTFNGIDTVRRKGVLARRLGVGVMVWEVSQDTDDALLIRTLTSSSQR